jgi:hypothetical protein
MGQSLRLAAVMRAVVVSSLLASSCSGQPWTYTDDLVLSDITGAYKLPDSDCPRITVGDGHISVGNIRMEAALVRIKEGYYLSTPQTMVYDLNGRCRISIKAPGRYMPIRRLNGMVQIEVFSSDFRYSVFYLKA